MNKKLVFCGLLMAATSLSAFADATVMFESNPAQKISGRSSAQWADAWWIWANSWNDNEGPLWSSDGADCLRGAQKDIVFIGGSYTNDPVHRTCRVNKGSRLFFPIFTSYQTKERSDCKLVAQELRSQIAEIESMYLAVDGTRRELPQLQSHQVASCGAMRQRSRPEISVGQDGYWFMTQPLNVGKYRFEFGGKWGDYQQDVIYDVEVR